MATGGGSFSHSVIHASDIIHNFSCSPCTQNGNNSDALYRCVECKTCLCAKCRDGHNQFVIGHNIVDVSAKDIGGSLVHSKDYTCEEHQDKLIEMYCKTHDNVFCAICVLQHRSCTGVDYIPNIAKTLLKNQDKGSVETELKQQCVELQKLKHNRLKYVRILAKEKDINEKIVKRYKEKLIKNAEELEKSLLLEVEKKYQAITEEVNLDMQTIDQLTNDVEKYLSKIVAGKYADDKDEVITFKSSEHQVIAANKQILYLARKKEEKVDFQCSITFVKCLGENRLGNWTERFKVISVSRKSLNTVHIYNADKENSEFIKRKMKDIQLCLTDVGIQSKVTEDLGVVNTGDLYICVVSDTPDLEKLVNDLNKGNVKKSRRYKVLVVCFVKRAFPFLLSPEPVFRKLCTDNNLPYICVDYQSNDFSDAVQLIRNVVDK